MSKFPLYNTTKSREMFNRASQVIPGGIYGHLGPAEGQWIPVNRWPSLAEKAQGSYFWDVDGNKYIDYMCAYGPNVLGYGDEDVDAAAIEQIKKGNCVTSPDKIMVECAELLVDTVASADWAFFAKNGNDATQGAILTARAIACTGDAYSILENNAEALKFYIQAADHADNVYAAAYLLKAGIICEEMGKPQEALVYYQRVKDNYPTTPEGYEIDKYITRIKVAE